MIGIVGGGISGLFLLHILRRRGVDAVLFEASDTPGGVMRSVEVEGPSGPLTVDLGPQRFRLTAGLGRIVDEVGLGPELVQAPRGVPFSMLWRGRLHPAPMSFAQAFVTPLISPWGKVEALVRDVVQGAPRRGESVAEALTRKLGHEVYQRLAGPLFGGLYASDPAEMDAGDSLLHALGRTRGAGPTDAGRRPSATGAHPPMTGPAPTARTPRSLLLALRRAARAERLPVISFRGGLGALPKAIAALHADRVRLGAPVTAIARHGSGGFEVTTGGGAAAGGAAIARVDRLVLTLPAPEAAPLLRSIAPEGADRLASLRYNPLAVVPLVRGPGRAPTASMGSGFKVTDVDPYETRGVTAHEALFGRKGLHTAFLGGRGHERITTLPDREVLETARREFRDITGTDATPLLVHRTRMPAWDRSWRALEDLALPEGIRLCSAYGARPGIPGRLEEAIAVAEALATGC